MDDNPTPSMRSTLIATLAVAVAAITIGAALAPSGDADEPWRAAAITIAE
ncbi:hypothetical protein [uncultured Demequina sp.]|nr:hypothetical protein [uncultured Demequina sp.]